MNRLTKLLYQEPGCQDREHLPLPIRSHALSIASSLVGFSALRTTLVLAVVGELLQDTLVTLVRERRTVNFTSSPPMCQSGELH
jgi:hypothetical protein